MLRVFRNQGNSFSSTLFESARMQLQAQKHTLQLQQQQHWSASEVARALAIVAHIVCICGLAIVSRSCVLAACLLRARHCCLQLFRCVAGVWIAVRVVLREMGWLST